MSLIKDICIGTAAFVVACVLTLSSSSIGGYPNDVLPYALAEEINTSNNNQSSSISILNKKGLDLLSSASYNEAITYFDKILAINSTDARALNNKGFALMQLGKYNDAITYFDKALAIEPNDATALNNKAFTLYSLGEYNEAISYYDKALAIRPNYASALNNKGLALNDLKVFRCYNIL
jgi:Flp pilus assembly protein TadD